MWKKYLLTISLILIVHQAFGAGVKIKKIKTRNNIVYCSLKAYVTDAIDMAWILNQGIDLKVNYSISVYTKTKRWKTDKLITNVNVFFLSSRDIINNGYEVKRLVGDYKQEYWISSQKSLFKFLMNTPYTPVISLNELSPSTKYYFQLQLFITSLDLYPPLSLIYQLLGRWSYRSPKINSRTFNYDSLLEN